MPLHALPLPMRFIVSHPRCRPACPSPGNSCAFQVAWAINPHMRVGAVRPEHAVRQHGNLVHILRTLGAIVEDLPFVHGAFDSVFTKDNAVLVERPNGTVEALLARPRHLERRAEQRARADALTSRGIRVVGESESPLEGGDVVMLPGGRGALLGHGFRSSFRAADALETFLDGAVTCVELRDPHLYHLDMVVSILDDGTALVCEDAVTESGRRALASHPAVRSMITVPRDEAVRFGINLVQVGATVVCAADAPTARRGLRRHGYGVRRVDLDQFHLAGGSAACLVSRVHRQGAASAVDEMRAPPSAA